MSLVLPIAFHLDSTAQEFAADGVLILFVALNVLLGWRAGLVRRLIGFGGAYLGVLGATYTGNGLASLFTPHDIYTNAWTFIAVFLIVIVLVEAIGALYNERLQKLIVVTFDRFSGAICGLLVGLLEAAIIFLVAINVALAPGGDSGSSHGINANAVKNGTLTEYVVKAEPVVKGIFGPALPSDFPGHLAVVTSPTPSP